MCISKDKAVVWYRIVFNGPCGKVSILNVGLGEVDTHGSVKRSFSL